MPTATIAMGQLARLVFLDEVTYGVPVSGLHKGSYFYKSTLREIAPPEADDVIGGDLNNFRDARPSTTGISTHDGELDLPWCLNGIGDWLRLLLGAPTTTNVSADYTHVFASGAAVLPSRTIELKALAADFRQHVGCVAKSLKIAAKDEKGFQKAMLALIGQGENLLTATGSTGTPAARPLDQFKATGALVFYAGVQIGVLLECDMTYSTGATPERYVDGTSRISAVSLSDEAQISGNLKIRYTGPSWDSIAVAEAVDSLELRWTKSSVKSISLLMPAVRIGRGGVEISGPGGVEQTLPFRAEQTAGAPMLTATLKNQQTSYA